jgi:hypothetical protein
MYQVNIPPTLLTDFQAVQSASNIPFQIITDQQGTFVISLQFTHAKDNEQLFDWLLRNAHHQTELATEPENMATITVNGQAITQTSAFQSNYRVFKALEADFTLTYVEKIALDRLVKFPASPELEDALGNLNNFNRQIEDGFFNAESNGLEVSGIISPGGWLRITIYSDPSAFLPRAEIFGTQLPATMTNQQIKDFISKYLTDANYRFSQIKSCLQDFLVSFDRVREQDEKTDE